jgi:uncharacterized protein DUF3501
MRKVDRSDIVDYQTYGDQRDATRAHVLDVKRPRRVHVGEHLTFLFENTETVRYQIQEMMRAEHIAREADIEREIATYNTLLGDAGELGCTLLVEIDDRDERMRRLREWRDLPRHVYIRCDDDSRVPARFDQAQVDPDKISAVQYLKFPLGDKRPLAVGTDLPGLTVETVLTPEQQAALLEDLR